MKYENDNQRKDINIETNSCNPNEGTYKRVAKGIYGLMFSSWSEWEMACFLSSRESWFPYKPWTMIFQNISPRNEKEVFNFSWTVIMVVSCIIFDSG